MTKISVVIPTHNRVSLLPRAIKSALNQSFSDIEVIVVSDGSTDGTDEQMKKLSEEDSFGFERFLQDYSYLNEIEKLKTIIQD